MKTIGEVDNPSLFCNMLYILQRENNIIEKREREVKGEMREHYCSSVLLTYLKANCGLDNAFFCYNMLYILQREKKQIERGR